MKHLSAVTIAVIASLHFFTISFAGEHSPRHEPKASGDIKLYGGLKALLQEEMALIEKSMSRLVREIASGNWEKIASIARNIEESFIIKKQLSKSQKEELGSKLPELFKDIDGEFHKAAGMLAKVADKRHAELVTFYFYKLSDSCVRCHSKYAKVRFPNFDKKTGGHNNSH